VLGKFSVHCRKISIIVFAAIYCPRKMHKLSKQLLVERVDARGPVPRHPLDLHVAPNVPDETMRSGDE
jgi:hypothetical protein